ncbi:MAG: hypothetical protein HHAS10_03160 [Candidatus Altimarinota bacterium]
MTIKARRVSFRSKGKNTLNRLKRASTYFSLQGILKFLFALGLLAATIGGIILYSIIKNTPSIDSIERGDYFQESTVIYDKDKQPIYTLYADGKRTYKGYTEISNSIKDAIISTEDKTFFENPGIDLKGLARAGINYVTGKTDRIKGTSTLSQQLISYTLLSKERSIKRKIKEAYLSYQLNKNYSKEKILEMYLNTISFGHNANGVEEASRTYFGKGASEVGPLGATILASLPKGPTYYSPYLHRNRLMGEVIVYPLDDPASKISLESIETRSEFGKMYTTFKQYLSGITLETDNDSVKICGINAEYIRSTDFSPDSSGCSVVNQENLLDFFGDILIKDDITNSGGTIRYGLEYTWGRKDFVGLRMYIDGKIDGPTLKKIIYDGIEFEFRKYAENIKYPYFVMYIKEYLEAKYGKDIDITQGLKVYTTLDPKLQEKAEELVKKQAEINSKTYGAKSAALVSMDNKNGALLAMVGGPDYFDTENGGNNNMTTKERQPGSSFKPIVYSLAISKNPIGPASPVADVKTNFSSYTPSNYDTKFKGVMPLEKALAYSRNIPAVKMFYLAGKEEEVVKFGRSIGLTTLKENAGYGAPMAIGTAEVRPIDLMQAYSVFANLGIKRDLYAIEKIVDSDGTVVEEHKIEENPKPIFSPAASYIITTILSNPDARPDGFWRSALTVNGRRVAAKTGTSNKEMGDDKILPRDLWTAGYSPQITTVVWAGNVDGKETKGTCDGLNCAAGIWKPFMEFAHKSLAKEDWKEPEGIYKYTIVKSSGRLAIESTPDDQKIQTIMAVKLTQADEGFKSVEVDTLCNGPVSENTPEGSIGTVNIPVGNPIIDGYDPAWKNAFLSSIGSAGGQIEPCERPSGPGNFTMKLKILNIGNNTSSQKKIVEGSWSGDREFKEWSLKFDGETKILQASEGKKDGSGRMNISLDSGVHEILLEVIDQYGYKYREVKTLAGGILEESETSNTGSAPIHTSGSLNFPSSNPQLSPSLAISIPPKITLTRPAGGNMSVYQGDTSNLRFNISVEPGVREVNVSLNGSNIYSANNGDSFVVPIDTTGLKEGTYGIVIKVIDANVKIDTKNVILTVLPK